MAHGIAFHGIAAIFRRLSLYTKFGLLNICVIFPPNVYYAIKEFDKQIKDVQKHNARYGDPVIIQTLNYVCMGIIAFVGLSGMAAIKTTAFGLAGPIGTYRIGLAFMNYKRSHKSKWIKTLFKPVPSLSSSYTPYIMRPFGNASWIPIKNKI